MDIQMKLQFEVETEEEVEMQKQMEIKEEEKSDVAIEIKDEEKSEMAMGIEEEEKSDMAIEKEEDDSYSKRKHLKRPFCGKEYTLVKRFKINQTHLLKCKYMYPEFVEHSIHTNSVHVLDADLKLLLGNELKDNVTSEVTESEDDDTVLEIRDGDVIDLRHGRVKRRREDVFDEDSDDSSSNPDSSTQQMLPHPKRICYAHGPSRAIMTFCEMNSYMFQDQERYYEYLRLVAQGEIEYVRFNDRPPYCLITNADYITALHFCIEADFKNAIYGYKKYTAPELMYEKCNSFVQKEEESIFESLKTSIPRPTFNQAYVLILLSLLMLMLPFSDFPDLANLRHIMRAFFFI